MRNSRLLLPVLLAALASLPACSGPELCSEPSERCTCSAATRGAAALVVLTHVASPAFSSAMERMTAPDARVFEDDRLGLDRTPVVILATYDDVGTIRELGSFNLAGEGTSASRKSANARLQAACLARSAAEVATGSGSGRGDLLRALSAASALAQARGEKRAAILAFGLGRSSVEGIDLDKIDLATPEARANVVRELVRVGILSAPQSVAVTFVDPDEGVTSGITAGFLNAFVDGELCPAVALERCQRMEVLP